MQLLEQISQTQKSNYPASAIKAVPVGTPPSVPNDSIFLITSMPSSTSPNTTCTPSNQLASSKVIKNYDLFVSGAYFAIDSNPAFECLRI